jgi:A/G-specific adenine glycosylase
VWASLWSLPQFDDAAAADVWLARHAGDAAPVMWLDDVAHGFSHYHLTLKPRLHRIDAPKWIADDDTLAWVASTDLGSLGIPAPIRTLLNRLFEN